MVSLELTTCISVVVSEEHVLRLNGNGYIAYGIRESYRRNVQLRDLLNTHSTKEKIRRVFSEIEVKIKTINNDGVLVFVLGRIRHTVLKVSIFPCMFVPMYVCDNTPYCLFQLELIWIYCFGTFR